MLNRRLTRCTAAVSCGIALAGPALAQTSPSTGYTAPGVLAEITVTAQKREQKISDVGLTVTALTGDQLSAAGIANITDLPKLTPGFTVGEGYTGYPVFSIRGVNFNASQFSAPPAVSTYLDEALLPYSAMAAGMLYDVERVEVLKGPQGTLFGQNATGGSINVIAAKPTREFAAGTSADVNSFGGVTLNAFLSGPLSNALSARLAVNTTQGGAWQHGYYLDPGQRNGDQEKGAARLLLDWKPVDSLTIQVNLNGFYDHSQPQLPQLASFNVVNPAAVYPGLTAYPLPTNGRQAEANPLTRYNNHNFQEVVRVDWDLSDKLRLTSITNYIDSKFDYPFDVDGTMYDIIFTRAVGTSESFNQELRLTGTADDGRVTYIVGGNFQNDDMTDAHDNEQLTHYSALPPNTTLNAAYDETNRAAAAFGNVDIAVADHFTVTGGVRYTKTTQTMKGCTADTGDGSAAGLFGYLSNAFRGGEGLPPTDLVVPGGCITLNDVGAPPTFLPVLTDVRQTQGNVSWRAGVNFKPAQGDLVYAVVSRAFKAGVFPFQDTVLESQVQPVRQEELTAYEVGFKSAFLDNRLHMNGAIFYYDYLDKQFFTYDPSPLGPSATIVNIPTSNVRGEDIDIEWAPAPALTLRGAVTHITTRIGTFQGYDIQLNRVDFTGKSFNYAPNWSGTADAEYKFRVGNGYAAFVGAGAMLNSTAYADLGESPKTELPAHVLYDARLGMESGGKWRAFVWGRNLTNKYYWINVAPATDVSTKFAGMPRMFGASVSYSF